MRLLIKKKQKQTKLKKKDENQKKKLITYEMITRYKKNKIEM